MYESFVNVIHERVSLKFVSQLHSWKCKKKTFILLQVNACSYHFHNIFILCFNRNRLSRKIAIVLRHMSRNLLCSRIVFYLRFFSKKSSKYFSNSFNGYDASGSVYCDGFSKHFQFKWIYIFELNMIKYFTNSMLNLHSFPYQDDR